MAFSYSICVLGKQRSGQRAVLLHKSGQDREYKVTTVFCSYVAWQPYKRKHHDLLGVYKHLQVVVLNPSLSTHISSALGCKSLRLDL